MADDVLLKLQNLEITSRVLVLRPYEEEIVIPLKDIGSYHLKWYLHEPIFGKKWWYLVLTVDLKDGVQDSAAVAFNKFNYVTDEHEKRQDIEAKITVALNAACPALKKSAITDHVAAASKQAQ